MTDINELKTVQDVLNAFHSGKVDYTKNVIAKANLGTALLRLYLKKSTTELDTEKQNIEKILSELSQKNAIDRANIGVVLNLDDRNRVLAKFPESVFIDKYTTKGTVAGYLLESNVLEKYNVRTNSVYDLAPAVIKLAEMYGLENRTVKKVKAHLKNAIEKTGSEKAKAESNLAECLNISMNGRGLKGIVLTASETMKAKEKQKLTDRIANRGLKIQGYKLRLQAIKLATRMQKGNSRKQDMKDFKKAFGLNESQINSLFE